MGGSVLLKSKEVLLKSRIVYLKSKEVLLNIESVRVPELFVQQIYMFI